MLIGHLVGMLLRGIYRVIKLVHIILKNYLLEFDESCLMFFIHLWHYSILDKGELFMTKYKVDGLVQGIIKKRYVNLNEMSNNDQTQQYYILL